MENSIFFLTPPLCPTEFHWLRKALKKLRILRHCTNYWHLCFTPTLSHLWYTVPSVEHGPKMFLLFSPLIDEKISSFLTYLKSWWKVVLVFGKEHANWFKISWVMIGWSWKIKLGKIHFFFGYTNFEFSKLDI